MADRLRMLLPRVLVVTVVWIIASGTLTFAADKTLRAKVAPKAPVAATKPTLLVPDVREQAYVFAKGILADGGFAWRVVGPVHGYATNLVASQSPVPGARIVDTGAPTIVLRLKRGPYAESGSPEDSAPFIGTAVRPLIDVNASAVATVSKKKAAAAAPKRKPSVKQRKHVRKARQHVPQQHRKQSRKTRKPQQQHRTKTDKARKHVPQQQHQRPPAFHASGAPREPLDEISLPARANLLDEWLTPSRRPSAANQRHWLYQHAWIVTGARFGWWHGADALHTLIRVDQRIEAQWGLGHRSELVARRALAAVQARAR